MIAIEAHNLTVRYDKKPALWNIDFKMPDNKLIGIMGPNGSGKSTLLKAIMGLLKPEGGEVTIFGKTIDEVRHLLAYVPQRQEIDWHFPATVYDVVEMGCIAKKSIYKRLNSNDRKVIDSALEKTGLENLKQRQIAQLSGGQQQRTFLARALAQQPELFLFDEPFAGVDMTTEKELMSLMKQLCLEGKSIIVVHHDLQSARAFFDEVLLLNTHMVSYGSTSETLNAQNLKAAFGGGLDEIHQLAHKAQLKNLPIRHK